MKSIAGLALLAGLTVAASAQPRAKDHQQGNAFVGEISDSLCGFKHPMPDAKRCTLGCVKGFDGKFVLADEQDNKVYNLSNQRKARQFAGAKVEVHGTLDGDTIRVDSIRAAQ